MRPADLLGLQADLLHRFEGNPSFQRVILGSLEAPYEAQGIGVPPWIENRSIEAITNWTRSAMAIEVTEHMTDLIMWVAAEMHETDPVDVGLAPSPYGFVHFDKPVTARDIHGEILHLDWMVWGPVPVDRHARAIAVIGFNDRTRPDTNTDNYIREMERQNPDLMNAMGRWVYTSFHVLADQERVGPAFIPPSFGVEGGARVAYQDPDFGGELSASTNVARLIFALWQVMNQPIADLQEEQPDRATRRRMTRMRIPPAVTVIRLRRPASHRHEGESGVEWNHHWLVRGHPRWQPYGVGRQERRLIWIGPHFRGNLDAPLKQTEKVYRVER